MGCASCGQRVQAVPVERQQPANSYSLNQVVSNADCPYTLDQLTVWAQKLKCFIQKGLYIQYNIAPSQLNKAYGDVLSSINYPSNLCYYQRELDRAQNLIMIVIGSGQC